MKKLLTLLSAAVLSALPLSACTLTDGSSSSTLYESQIAELKQRIEELENLSLSDEIENIKNSITALEDKIDTQQNYSIVQLNTENYQKYLSINLTLSDCIAIFREVDTLGSAHYDLSCVVTITTSAATDCKFEGFASAASISYNNDIVGWQSGVVGASAHIDYNGNSSVSFALWKTDTILYQFPSLQRYNVSVASIFGNVLIPE